MNVGEMGIFSAIFCAGQRIFCGLALALLAFSQTVVAADAEPEMASKDVRYMELKPTFVANFGPLESRHLMYVKTDITVQMNGKEAEDAATYHLPALRHELVMLLSKQSEQALATSEGRELVRQEALASLNELLKKEEGKPMLDDLLFTNLLLQR